MQQTASSILAIVSILFSLLLGYITLGKGQKGSLEIDLLSFPLFISSATLTAITFVFLVSILRPKPTNILASPNEIQESLIDEIASEKPDLSADEAVEEATTRLLDIWSEAIENIEQIVVTNQKNYSKCLWFAALAVASIAATFAGDLTSNLFNDKTEMTIAGTIISVQLIISTLIFCRN